MKATEPYPAVLPFIMRYKVVRTFSLWIISKSMTFKIKAIERKVVCLTTKNAKIIKKKILKQS